MVVIEIFLHFDWCFAGDYFGMQTEQLKLPDLMHNIMNSPSHNINYLYIKFFGGNIFLVVLSAHQKK